ncbi:hypothetical protein DYB25_001317 [Aphanomyces astaci]|uniref:Uncharacterized protein n=1 Tax=Aphanomyces astaci TaxID=112090 RepID=A0A397B6M8_APHAT|nr:hypothetical protein DYB36_000967 [Aphanomyces astaci]RHY14834.1 hypothetical protein DYB25_001317 [Aphanomyces astaci]RHY37713.1 hypothetical protein DYB34_001904 [Aphanomyces astaci]RHY59432.1 hypothetical protein DYB38_000539 [Aphanomyces astaci]RHY72620.1 hypothetical protein DYB30_001814 [Aphanomyces astaci]
MATRSPTKLALDKAMHRPASPSNKSPVKKALLKHWDAQPEGEDSAESTRDTSQLRTELLHKVLQLLDQDASVVDFVASLVDKVSTLPLQDATMRTAFLAQLHDVHPTKPGRTSGRTRCLNPHSCRAFILACANEIVDLDENDPSFDYAETCVDSDEFKDLALRPVTPLNPPRVLHVHLPNVDYAETLSSCSSQPDARTSSPPADVAMRFRRVLRQHFDYASSAHASTCSSECESDECLQHAFSKLHQHAQDLAQKRLVFAEFKRQMPMEPMSPPKRQLTPPRYHRPHDPPMKDLASKFQSFEALKANRSSSPVNVGRKKRAFYKFKTQHAGAPQHIHVQSHGHRPKVAASAFLKDCALSALLVALAFIAFDELKLW